MTNCQECAHWNISETDMHGKQVLTWWGKKGFGCCARIGNWHYTPMSHTCTDYRAADEETVKRRKKALAAAERQNKRRQTVQK